MAKIREFDRTIPSTSLGIWYCKPVICSHKAFNIKEPDAQTPRFSYDPVEVLLGSIAIRDYSEKARIILALRPDIKELDYLDFLLRILREVLKTQWKAPIPFQVMYVAERLTEYQLAAIRGAGIYAVNIDSLKTGTSDEASFMRFVKTLSDRLREIFAQGPGYLVLYGSAESLALVKRLWEPRIVARHAVFTSLPPYIEVTMPTAGDALKRLAMLFYGNLYELIDADTLSQVVLKAEENYTRALEVLANDPLLAFYSRQAIDDEEARPETAFTHYALKLAAIKHVIDIGIDPSTLNVETIVANVPIDIRIERGWGSSIAIEIETLFGSGNPVTRLSTIIRERLSLGYSVWIIVPPMQAFMYKPYIELLLNRFESRVEFYTLNASRLTLIPVMEYYEVLERVLEALRRQRVSETK
ncbi:hypothetical protein PYJP_15990 [Pyrofollis japonicus]|uniref:hypothetical protein n=1 Tax=Pyrofollis japonicus TaxID=3060460 RepID=UPI00295AF677|nr:hypothetical protein [Pyrofollis japonicus]BEP18247.1 hypothetical protein PYJP_15990 [Pyrofollis japonicus]